MLISDGSVANFGKIENGTSLFALREEYCTKLEKLVEQNQEERTDLQGTNMTMKQKVDG